MPIVSPAEYIPRHPHDTVLYRIVQEHLATFLEHTERTYATPLPKYVVDTFEDYLLCGDFSQGFVRCHCDDCGHDLLVAFSCKNRGLCPSCGVRRMYNEAAHIVDRVLPNVPLRQWIVSLPWELRGLAVAKPEVLGAVDRIFAEEIACSLQERANLPGSETGLLSFRQVFGGALNVHPHLHDLAVDGVFTKVDDSVRFHEAPPPSQDDVAMVARRVRDRFVEWLRRHGYVDERAAEERGNEPAEPSALEGCLQLALAGGAFLARPFENKPDPDADLDHKERRFSARCDGFDVHCAVVIAADDDEGRERLIRYCARPPFSLERLSVLRDGRIAYQLKTPRRGNTHRVMDAMELMARLAALIPAPRLPTIRYHGVFASSSSWRPLVTPKPRTKAVPASLPCLGLVLVQASAAEGRDPSAPVPVVSVPSMPLSPTFMPPPAAIAPFEPWVFSGGSSPPPSPPVKVEPAEPVATVEPTRITVQHWGRLQDGELLATSRYVDWATLMKRTWDVDVMKCQRCGGRLRVLATITDPEVSKRILEHLHVRSSPLPRAPARDPAWDQQRFEYEAA